MNGNCHWISSTCRTTHFVNRIKLFLPTAPIGILTFPCHLLLITIKVTDLSSIEWWVTRYGLVFMWHSPCFTFLLFMIYVDCKIVQSKRSGLSKWLNTTYILHCLYFHSFPLISFTIHFIFSYQQKWYKLLFKYFSLSMAELKYFLSSLL